jgi:AAA15 family ATPase/GTPase
MIESIEIKNFRCFKDTKIAKFGLVNLFGGLNNSGKTALLEAIFLVENPYCEAVVSLINDLRNESRPFGIAKPENKWDNFFYQQKKDNFIQINTLVGDKKDRKLSLICNDDIDDFISFHQENLDKNIPHFINKKTSALHIEFEDNNEKSSAVLVASNAGVNGKNKVVKKSVAGDATFLLSGGNTSFSDLAIGYETARHDKKGHLFLTAFQIIDKNIEAIDVFSIGEPVIHLIKKDGTRLPLSLFGDAMNKVASFILSIINQSNNVVLIDEIENGIHYTKQAELWEMLFKLAIEFNVQIFSTSHSLEMIKAFAKVAQQFPEKAAYFEMARHYKTGNIIGTSIPIDILEYDIENNFRFRGE